MAKDTDIEFRAPWSARLRSTSMVTTVVLAAVLVSGIASWSRANWLVTAVLIIPPIVIVLSALPFMVRGYVLTDDAILVKRLGWITRLPLQGLVSIAGNDEAMLRSIRLFGNGGLFSFTGEYWNRSLGRYRALATDASRAIVLKYPRRRIVITPHDTQKFIVQSRNRLKNRV